MDHTSTIAIRRSQSPPLTRNAVAFRPLPLGERWSFTVKVHDGERLSFSVKVHDRERAASQRRLHFVADPTPFGLLALSPGGRGRREAPGEGGVRHMSVHRALPL